MTAYIAISTALVLSAIQTMTSDSWTGSMVAASPNSDTLITTPKSAYVVRVIAQLASH